MKTAAAQISGVPGDAKANISKFDEFSARARESGAKLIVFPEMTDTGYSMPDDPKNIRLFGKKARCRN